MAFVGMDPERIRRVAEQLRQNSHQLTMVNEAVQRLINQAAQAWEGQDTVDFSDAWSGQHRLTLQQCAQQLEQMSSDAVEQIAQQETTSGIIPGGPGSALPPGAVPPGTKPSGPGGTPGTPGGGFDPWSLVPGGPVWSTLFEGPGGAGALLGLAGLSSKAEDITSMASHLKLLGGTLDGSEWGTLLRGSMVLEEGTTAARAVSVVEGAGKLLGPLGVVVGGLTTAKDIHDGDYPNAAYDGVTTALGIAALTTPPPADIICGAIAGGMALGKIIDPNIANHIMQLQKMQIDLAIQGGEALLHGGEAIVDGAGDVIDGAADVAEDVGGALVGGVKKLGGLFG